MTAIALNGTTAVSARLTIPNVGVWMAVVKLDIAPPAPVPSGRAVLTIGTETLVGTVDGPQTGRVGSRATVVVLGGGGGWGRQLPALHFHNDVAVTTTSVYAATGAAVGEVVKDLAPSTLGTDFVRVAGAASRALAGTSWWVDAAGVTNVGARTPMPLSSDADILDWDAEARRASIALDAIVWPGTTFTDSRIGTARVRDVEQTFGESGARANAWCDTGSDVMAEPAGAKLARALGIAARESVRPWYLARHVYRLIEQGSDGRCTLQAITRGGELPDILKSVLVWPGIAGVTQKLAPGTNVHVMFVANDARLPVVVAFAQGGTPLETKLDAVAVKVGGGTAPAARATPTLLTWLGAVTTYVNGLAPGTLVAPVGVASTKLLTD